MSNQKLIPPGRAPKEINGKYLIGKIPYKLPDDSVHWLELSLLKSCTEIEVKTLRDGKTVVMSVEMFHALYDPNFVKWVMDYLEKQKFMQAGAPKGGHKA